MTIDLLAPGSPPRRYWGHVDDTRCASAPPCDTLYQKGRSLSVCIPSRWGNAYQALMVRLSSLHSYGRWWPRAPKSVDFSGLSPGVSEQMVGGVARRMS